MIVAIIYLIALVIFMRYIDKTLKEMGKWPKKKQSFYSSTTTIGEEEKT
jgi:hypothetical protein